MGRFDGQWKLYRLFVIVCMIQQMKKNIAILERKGIEFKNMQLKNGQFVDLGQREKRKKRIRQQTELEKQVQMIIRKPKKVKPGYKKKRKYQESENFLNFSLSFLFSLKNLL